MDGKAKARYDCSKTLWRCLLELLLNVVHCGIRRNYKGKPLHSITNNYKKVKGTCHVETLVHNYSIHKLLLNKEKRDNSFKIRNLKTPCKKILRA